MNMDTLVLLDNHPKMVNSFVGDYHVWYGYRHEILISIISKHLKLDRPKIVLQYPLKKTIFYLWLTIIKFPYMIKNKTIIFFGSNVQNLKETELYTNRLYDFFYSQYNDTSLLMEDSYRREYRIPRKVPVYYNDFIYLIAHILRKFIIIKKDIYAELKIKLFEFKSIIRKELGQEFDDTFWEKLFFNLVISYKNFLIEKKLYSIFLKRIQPKIVFREDGSYGGSQALSYVCNKFNIIYAEFQHGFVSQHHPAYNYGEQFFRQEKLKKLLPQYFLTFGKHWSKGIRIPGEKIEIGSPYLQDKAVNAKRAYQIEQTNLKILIVSDGNAPILFNNLTIELSHKKILNKSCDIIFKLHPAEVPLLQERYHQLLTLDNVSIKTYDSVYSLLLDVDIVIGCNSTVMFEAYYFKHRPYVYFNEFSLPSIGDMSIFEVFTNIPELIEKIEYNYTNKPDNNKYLNYLWEQHPKECFERFINKVL